jgi:hypothetical protein
MPAKSVSLPPPLFRLPPHPSFPSFPGGLTVDVVRGGSTPEDMGPFFDPANDKAYRHPQFYKIPRGIREE